MGDVIRTGTVSLAGAEKVAAVALDEARARGLRIAVAVTGAAGDLVAFARMDGVPPLAGETARRKCWSVVTTRRSTRDFGTMLKDDFEAEPELFHGMLRIGDMVAIAGGVPLVADGGVVGAIAVSGASSDDDHEIAEHAARAIAAVEWD